MKNTFVISCPIDTYSGYGSRSRDLVKSIIELDKYDVKIIPQKWGMCPFGYLDDHEEWSFLKDYLVTHQMSSQPDIWMQITVPNEFQPIGKYNIGVSAIVETTACHQTWIEGCNRMDLILVSSQHSKTVLENTKFNRMDNRTQQPVGELKIEKPVEVLFEGVDINLFKPLKSKDIDFDLSYVKENWCYLFVGHWMQGEFGEDRKNVGLLVKAFYETFKNKKNAPALILKTSRGGGSKIDRREIMNKIHQLRNSCKAHSLPSVYLIHGELTENEMVQLYNHPKIKAMACITKGEGFGRPLLEFSLVNKPIITTNWSGHLDFLNKEYTSLVGGEVKQIHPSAVVQNILIPESGWFAPNAAEVNHYLTDIHKKYKPYKENAKRQGYQSRTNFNFEKMKEKIDEYFTQYIPEIAKEVPLTLPSLPKLELPKLKKV